MYGLTHRHAVHDRLVRFGIIFVEDDAATRGCRADSNVEGGVLDCGVEFVCENVHDGDDFMQ